VKRFAINGAGRIGRLVIREYLQRKPENLQLVALNDLTDNETLAYLLEFDSVHGRIAAPVEISGDQLQVSGVAITVYHQPDPEHLPWSELAVDWVLEATGVFRKREEATKHLAAGAGRVLISAPSESADLTIIHGVNQGQFNPAKHQIVSSGSCTTNSLVPPLSVLLEAYGIETASATTIHAYQGLVDVASRKRIRGRAAALNLVPTSTGADKVVAAVLPDLAGKFSALAVRAPIADGGLTDITVRLQQPVTVDEVNQRLSDACENALKGVMDFTLQEWVSSDIVGNPHSAIVHGLSTRVIGDRTVKLQVWYDNEFAYACRLLDLLETL
jgi:glyceraldehyde 3-phosphate dehydrogenase/glyceraldehyde-3-phosphate dehydrogenase (NAD(P))